MKKNSLNYDDSLIISRLQQKELDQIKPGLRISHSLAPIEKVIFDPIAYNLPVKIKLSLSTIGTKIISAQIERGFYYQELENRLATLSYNEALQALALLNFKTPVFYQLALTRAMEALCALSTEPKTELLRVWVLSFARIYHHAQVISDVLLSLKLDALNDLARTAINIMKPLADIFTRVHIYAPEQIQKQEIINLLESLENIFQELEASLNFHSNARLILRKKAVVTLSMAASFGLSGIYLRANRSSFQRPGLNDGPSWEISEGGDAWARFSLRIFDIKSCLEWLKKNTLNSSLALIDNRPLTVNQAVHPFAFGEVSGPEGDIKISIFLENTREPRFYLRSPAYFVAQALPHLLAQADLGDLPWILYSLGISAEEIDK